MKKILVTISLILIIAVGFLTELFSNDFKEKEPEDEIEIELKKFKKML